MGSMAPEQVAAALETIEDPAERYRVAQSVKELCDDIRARALNDLTGQGASYNGLAKRFNLRRSTVRYMVEKARQWRTPSGQWIQGYDSSGTD